MSSIRITGAEYLRQSGQETAILTAKVLAWSYNNGDTIKSPEKRVDTAAFVAEIYEAIAAQARLDETSLRNEIERWAGVRRGCRVRDDWAVEWWVFDAQRWGNQAVLDFLAKRGVDIRGHRCHTGDYDCCGRWGTNEVLLRRNEFRVLATQRSYRDC